MGPSGPGPVTLELLPPVCPMFVKSCSGEQDTADLEHLAVTQNS